MAAINPYQVYKNQSVMLASPEELTYMLYNGCAKFIRQAEMAINNHDIPGANEYIKRAQDIISELMSTLDMSYNVSQGLMAIYDYIYRCLVDANIAKDKAVLNEALGLVIELRETWSEAMKISASKAASGRG
ncbi:MAG: flagellar export chaperone FliS [Dethiobacteria bacterium]|jgi:flagellar protein FliS